MAAPPTARPDPPNATSDSALDVRNSHALLLGKGGEATARFALEHDGTMIHWNASGTAAASPPGEAAAVAGTRVHPPRTAKSAWPALRLAAAGTAGATHSALLAVEGAVPGLVFCRCL